jgi:uroporphyrinogen decarboxylase
MRQAGRYMPEYRALRAKHSMLELCKTPELAAEVTLQPIKAFDLDAAILFADILLPLEPMGSPFDFAAGEGPVFEHPVRTAQDIHALRLIDPEESLGYVLEAIRHLRGELGGRAPLIGFAGAPFTLASYLVEGGKSSNYLETKRLMYGAPELWDELMGKLAEVVRRFLLAQIKAGAQAVQLFDSWIGALSPEDYAQYVQPHVRHVLQGVMGQGVPVIHFGTGTATLLELQREAGGSVMGIDWRVPLEQACARLPGIPLQGNLDPTLLMAPPPVLEKAIARILNAGRAAPGHVFNVGHGIILQTDPAQVALAVELVHRLGERRS